MSQLWVTRRHGQLAVPQDHNQQSVLVQMPQVQLRNIFHKLSRRLKQHLQRDSSASSSPTPHRVEKENVPCVFVSNDSQAPGAFSDSRPVVVNNISPGEVPNGQDTAVNTRRPNNLAEEHDAQNAKALDESQTLDLWSAAFQEAVTSFGDEIDLAILKGKSTAQLFQSLEDIHKEATNESCFVRGVRHLHKLQVPLERFKLALDLAVPLASIDPTQAASTVVGVVQAVTAIAISCATADLDFSRQIAEMLEQISYIDDCDTLGQRSNQKDIHQALVVVYKKLLEFYQAAFDVLTRKGVRLVLKVILETAHLPTLVGEFLIKAEILRKLIEKATWEIVEDVRAMLYDREISQWLDSSKLSQQSEYHAQLQATRADKACEFLLLEPNLIEWYCTLQSQQLLLFGDMGSGKSVAISYLIDTLGRRNEHQLPRPKICYHYCRDSKTGDLLHILSTIILALLEQLAGLKKVFYEWYNENQASGHLDPARNAGKLEEFLQTILPTVDRSVLIIVDGLDECDRVSRNRLLLLTKKLLQSTPRLKVLMSSRFQQEILEQLPGVPKVNMVSDAERDSVIVRQTVKRQIPYLTDEAKALVIERLSSLAQGSGIWTKMVVDLIEVRGIRAIGPLRLFLKEVPLPSHLSTLYKDLLLERCSNDPENLQLASAALRLLAVCRRPLGILELAWPATMEVGAQRVTSVAALADLVDHQRIMQAIYPFIVRVDFGDLKKHQVQLGHQSIKEFIIQELTVNDSVDVQPKTTKASDNVDYEQCVEILEAQALQLCTKYLLLDEIDSLELLSDEQKAIEELPQSIDLFTNGDETPVEYNSNTSWEVWEENMVRYDPTERGFGEFFVYASSHWVDHFGAIKSGPLPDVTTIERLCQPASRRIDNWIQQNRRPGCVLIARFPFDSNLYDALAITSLYGSEAMLRKMLQPADLDEEMYLPGSLMGAADQILCWGDLSRLRIIYSERVHRQLDELGFFVLVMRHWSSSRRATSQWDTVFDLVPTAVEAMVRDRWGNKLLCMAAHLGCLPVIQSLIHEARQMPQLMTELFHDPRREQSRPMANAGQQSIGEAVLADRTDVVDFLLQEPEIDRHLQYTAADGRNVLHLASEACNPVMFDLLVPRLSAGVYATDQHGDIPLALILKSSSGSEDRRKCMSISLQHGSPSSDHDVHQWQDLLHMAARLGDPQMCELLESFIRGFDGVSQRANSVAKDQGSILVEREQLPVAV